VLEEVGVQVLVESVLELHLAGLPVDLVGEVDVGSRLEFLPTIGGQGNVHDLLAIVANVELLVRKDIVLAIPFVPFSDFSPYRKTINIHLVPVLVLHRIGKSLGALLRQGDHADDGSRCIDLELHLVATELQLYSLEGFAQGLVVVGNRGFLAAAKG